MAALQKILSDVSSQQTLQASMRALSSQICMEQHEGEAQLQARWSQMVKSTTAEQYNYQQYSDSLSVKMQAIVKELLVASKIVVDNYKLIQQASSLPDINWMKKQF